MNRLDDPPSLMKGRKPSFIGMNGIFYIYIIYINYIFIILKTLKIVAFVYKSVVYYFFLIDINAYIITCDILYKT